MVVREARFCHLCDAKILDLSKAFAKAADKFCHERGSDFEGIAGSVVECGVDGESE
jgi:hypothetical protein